MIFFYKREKRIYRYKWVTVISTNKGYETIMSKSMRDCLDYRQDMRTEQNLRLNKHFCTEILTGHVTLQHIYCTQMYHEKDSHFLQLERLYRSVKDPDTGYNFQGMKPKKEGMEGFTDHGPDTDPHMDGEPGLTRATNAGRTAQAPAESETGKKGGVLGDMYPILEILGW